MTQIILKRSEVNPVETWDLSDLYTSFSHWNESLEKLPSIKELENILNEKYRSKLSTSVDILFQCLQYKDQINRHIENLYVYAGLRSAENLTDNEANEALGKIEFRMSEINAAFAFLEPEILQIPQLEKKLKKDPLKLYAFKLQEILRGRSHLLSEAEEAILSHLSVSLHAFDTIHSKWDNADLKFESALDSQGQEHLVSNARYALNLQSPDRDLRKNTFDNFYKEIAKWRNTITSNYFGHMAAGSSIAKIRKFNSFLEAELFGDNIPASLYTNLISTVHSELPLLHKSMNLRKKILKLNSIAPYDRLVSLFKNPKESKFSWEEGRDLVLAAVAPLGEDYVNIAKKGLTDERWIDRSENEGKRSGAFSWGTYDSHPYMLQTWTGTLRDVYTLAHELGHSMHSFMSHKSQPYHDAHYSIFVAEVASTLNEALLTDHILNNMPNSDLAKAVISESIQNFEGTVLRQVLFAAFEFSAAQIVDEGKTFTPDLLEHIYKKLNQDWYGKDCEYPEAVQYEWMRIPHFYSSFYVYKYATSYCASLALLEDLKKNPLQTQDKIFSLLKAGSSKPSLTILKDAGVDFLTPYPIKNAFKNYERCIDIAEKTFL